MHPVLMFATGLVTGIVGIGLAKKATATSQAHALGDKTRKGVEQARSGLRQATVDGLAAVERTSASLRSKLETPPAPAAETPAADAAAPAQDGPKS